MNSRDEALCGNGGEEYGRIHCIFYDNNLCQVAQLLKVGAMQIVLAMIEAGDTITLDYELRNTGLTGAASFEVEVRLSENLLIGDSDLLLETLLDLGLSIGALTILGGTLLGFRLARPIRELAHVVDLARHGDASVRAAAHGDDEIAFLARSVNDLLDQTRDLADPKTGK